MEERLNRIQLKEETVHGTVHFPLAVYRKERENISEREFYVQLHWHEETEIIYLKEGKFTMDINMHRYQWKAPAFVFINAGDIHAIRGEKECEESAVVFDMRMLSFEHYDSVQYQVIRPLLEKKMQFPLIIDRESGAWREMQTCYESVLEEAPKETLSARLRIKASLMQILATLYETGSFSNMENGTDYDNIKIENVKKVLGFVQTNYGRDISVKDMAKVLQMNPQYFCRYFKKVTGKTPTEYVNEIRVEKAAGYLQQTDRKIIDIGMECGYDNMSYFIRRFREVKGMTPSEYRKKSK